MSTKREDQLEAAFLEGGTAIHGLNMRPFSLGTLNLCKRLRLSMFIEEQKDSEPELAADEVMRQLAVFAWMQSAPLEEVRTKVRDGTWEDAVDAFSFDLSVDTISALTREITRISALSQAAAVEVAPKPGDKPEKDAPPNS